MSTSTSLQASSVQASATGITQGSSAQPVHQHQVEVVVPSYSMSTVAVVWFTGAFVGGVMGAIGFLTYWRTMNPLIDPCEDFGGHVCGQFRGPELAVYEMGWNRVAVGVAGLIRTIFQTKQGAVGKALFLFESCRAVHGQTWSRHRDLQNFMARLKLSVSSTPPQGAPTSPDAVLELHVELAYAYGLSALLKMRPRGKKILAVKFNGALMRAALTSDDDPGFIISLAKVVGVTADPALVLTRTELYTKMRIAVVEGHQKQASLTKRRGVIEAKDMDFRGVKRDTFGSAVESKTPYSRTSRFFVTPILVAMLESVWRALSSNAQLFSWTSWHVADALVPYVEPGYTVEDSPHARFTDVTQFAVECFHMVSQVMGGASHIRRSRGLSGERNRESDNRNRPRRGRMPERKVYVGSPDFAMYYNALDSFYGRFPTTNISGPHFFAQWVAAAQAWRNFTIPGAYFDPMEPALDVASNATLVVPAILARHPFFDQERLIAANVGSIGHLIAMTLAERYLRPNVSLPAACQSPPGSRTAGAESIASLLAYECSLEAMVAIGGDKDPQLPRLAELSPERMLFISGCFKECVFHRTTSSTCPYPPMRLKVFREAFWCNRLQPPCAFT
ncbi:hypothetical protein MTO96_002272 [Rhipicephalus appendiculatus]